VKTSGLSRAKLLLLVGILIMVAGIFVVRLGRVKPAAITEFLIEFDGPWGLVPDPQHAGDILAIAPKNVHHRPLTVSGSASATLDAGVYTLDIPVQGVPDSPNPDPTFFRVRVDPKNVQHALDARMERYAIQLPRPASYVGTSRGLIAIGSAPKRQYVMTVALRYNVAPSATVSLTGGGDTGDAAKALRMEARDVRFSITPIPDPNDPEDRCEVHTREAFAALAKLLGLDETMAAPPGCPGDEGKMKMP
jgi:hypothetical protein